MVVWVSGMKNTQPLSVGQRIKHTAPTNWIDKLEDPAFLFDSNRHCARLLLSRFGECCHSTHTHRLHTKEQTAHVTAYEW